MNYQGIEISENWGCVVTFQWMCENARFIFSHKSYGGERIKIVIKEQVRGFDCFGIGYDRFGVTVDSDTVFNEGWGNMIEDSSTDIVKYIKDYLIREGASDLIVEPITANS